MTPKEKCDELFLLFGKKCRDYELGKQCALIAVDEILSLPINEWCAIEVPYQDWDYWQEVKNEIEKL